MNRTTISHEHYIPLCLTHKGIATVTQRNQICGLLSIIKSLVVVLFLFMRPTFILKPFMGLCRMDIIMQFDLFNSGTLFCCNISTTPIMTISPWRRGQWEEPTAAFGLPTASLNLRLFRSTRQARRPC